MKGSAWYLLNVTAWSIPILIGFLIGPINVRSETLPACPSWEGKWQETKVFFGLSKSGENAVSRRAVDEFVQSEIVSAFPKGFTLVETTGYWKDRDTQNTRYENGLMLVLLHEKTPENDQRIDKIADAFRLKFEQQSVLIAKAPSHVRSC